LKKIFIIGLIVISIYSSLLGVTIAQPELDWVETFGGVDWDAGYSVKATPDGGYIVAGCTISYGVGYTDSLLVKFDSEGKYEWKKTYGTSNYDEGFDVLVTPNGDYVIAGYVGPGEYDTALWFVKSDGSTDTLKQYPQSGYDEGYSVVSAPDGGYLIAGWIEEGHSRIYDVYVLKTDKDGVEEERYRYGGSGDQRGRSIKVTPDEGFIVTGSHPDGVYLVKADKDGEQDWDEVYGGICGYDVQLASDGGYIVTGSHEDGVFLMKTYYDGVMDWIKTYGGIHGESLQETPDGGYLICGKSSEGIYLVKTDKKGNKEWDTNYEGEIGYSVIITPDGNYVIAGATASSGAGSRDLILLSTDLDPQADFYYTPISPDEGTSIQFKDTTDSHPDEIVSWSWDFGGEGTSTEENPEFIFTDDRAYTVSLTVTDDDGSTDTVSNEVTVHDMEPNAEFTSKPTSPMKGDQISFTDKSSSASDAIVTWTWDFGGEGTSTQENPEFTFNELGEYRIKLTVTDDDG